MKHTVKVHYSSAVFYLLKKTLEKACGAIAPHRPNVDPSLDDRNAESLSHCIV